MLKNDSCIQQTQGGYTLLNTIVSFSIFFMLLSFFPILLMNVKLEIKNEIYQALLFFEYVDHEITQAKQLTTQGDTLYITTYDGTHIQIQKYQSNIRRQVYGMGNEILLQKVDDLHYELVPNGVIISITISGTRMQKRVSMAPQIL